MELCERVRIREFRAINWFSVQRDANGVFDDVDLEKGMQLEYLNCIYRKKKKGLP